MNYLKHGVGTSRATDEQHDLMRPMTPRSERKRRNYGSLLSGVQTTEGLCTLERKCFRRDGHDGACYPDA